MSNNTSSDSVIGPIFFGLAVAFVLFTTILGGLSYLQQANQKAAPKHTHTYHKVKSMDENIHFKANDTTTLTFTVE